MLGLTILIASPGHSKPAGSLTSRPTPVETTLSEGLSTLPHGAYAYRPASAPEAGAALLVLLHGTDGRANQIITAFRPVADRRGCILLALQSARWDWDMADEVWREMNSMGREPSPEFGPDVARTDAVLLNLFATTSIDPKRVVLLGFSDGAGYALSLGLANPDLFSGIIVLSGGFAKVPTRVDPRQRIFIAHGTRDERIPLNVVEHEIVAPLMRLGLNVRFKKFAGGHRIEGESLREGLEFTLGPLPGRAS